VSSDSLRTVLVDSYRDQVPLLVPPFFTEARVSPSSFGNLQVRAREILPFPPPLLLSSLSFQIEAPAHGFPSSTLRRPALRDKGDVRRRVLLPTTSFPSSLLHLVATKSKREGAPSSLPCLSSDRRVIFFSSFYNLRSLCFLDDIYTLLRLSC